MPQYPDANLYELVLIAVILHTAMHWTIIIPLSDTDVRVANIYKTWVPGNIPFPSRNVLTYSIGQFVAWFT
jgi:hypothetical protein